MVKNSSGLVLRLFSGHDWARPVGIVDVVGRDLVSSPTRSRRERVFYIAVSLPPVIGLVQPSRSEKGGQRESEPVGGRGIRIVVSISFHLLSSLVVLARFALLSVGGSGRSPNRNLAGMANSNLPRRIIKVIVFSFFRLMGSRSGF